MTTPTSQVEQFRRLYNQLYDDLWKYCQRRSPSTDEASEVLADVMLALWERIDDVPSNGEARPWAFGVARNQLRKRHSVRQRNTNLARRLVTEFRQRRTIEPSEVTEAQAVLEALSELDEQDQELLRLTGWENLSHAEVASILDISENAVAIRLHRARQKFNYQIQKLTGGPK